RAVGDHLDRCETCRAIVVAAVRGNIATLPHVVSAGAAALTMPMHRRARMTPGRVTPPHAPPGTGALGRGTVIGRYELEERLGGGGMGVVYAARDRELDRSVALRLWRADSPTAPVLAERLVRESRLMAKVRHPSVLTIYDAGRDGDRVYLAMERVDGTLGRWLAA